MQPVADGETQKKNQIKKIRKKKKNQSFILKPEQYYRFTGLEQFTTTDVDKKL